MRCVFTRAHTHNVYGTGHRLYACIIIWPIFVNGIFFLFLFFWGGNASYFNFCCVLVGTRWARFCFSFLLASIFWTLVGFAEGMRVASVCGVGRLKYRPTHTHTQHTHRRTHILFWREQNINYLWRVNYRWAKWQTRNMYTTIDDDMDMPQRHCSAYTHLFIHLLRTLFLIYLLFAMNRPAIFIIFRASHADTAAVAFAHNTVCSVHNNNSTR